jgi:hypothetical protein
MKEKASYEKKEYSSFTTNVLSFFGIVSIIGGIISLFTVNTLPFGVGLIISGAFMLGFSDVISNLREVNHNTKKIYKMIYGQIIQNYEEDSGKEPDKNDKDPEE